VPLPVADVLQRLGRLTDVDACPILVVFAQGQITNGHDCCERWAKSSWIPSLEPQEDDSRRTKHADTHEQRYQHNIPMTEYDYEKNDRRPDPHDQSMASGDNPSI
jgi:hypothetical protein